MPMGYDVITLYILEKNKYNASNKKNNGDDSNNNNDINNISDKNNKINEKNKYINENKKNTYQYNKYKNNVADEKTGFIIKNTTTELEILNNKILTEHFRIFFTTNILMILMNIIILSNSIIAGNKLYNETNIDDNIKHRLQDYIYTNVIVSICVITYTFYFSYYIIVNNKFLNITLFYILNVFAFIFSIIYTYIIFLNDFELREYTWYRYFMNIMIFMNILIGYCNFASIFAFNNSVNDSANR